MLLDSLAIATQFARTRWLLDFRDRRHLEDWQQRQLRCFLRDVLPKAPRYQGFSVSSLAELPIMDKATMMSDFAAGNTHGVSAQEALEIALRAEASRDFAPQLGDLTVGLSSGTSGNRGIFLVSKAERLRWAGTLLARALPSCLLNRLISPWQAPLRIAFFLRANSNLYTTLASRRIDFTFYDQLLGLDAALPRLALQQPDVLVAPPSMLRALASQTLCGQLHIRPSHVISVADVLEPRDAEAVESAFGHRPHQLYQATEGFLAYTCEAGCLHMNETFIHIEKQWLDEERTRFQPVITDFSRHAQLIVRYRLNDVLRVHQSGCTCGRAELAIEAIEGRSDEVLWLHSIEGRGRCVSIWPDQVRRAMLLAGTEVREYDIAQQGMRLKVSLLANASDALASEAVERELTDLWRRVKARPPTLAFSGWQSVPAGAKRRRIRVENLPEGVSCTF